MHLKGGDLLKRQWKKPMLEILEFNMTMGGNGSKYPDCLDAGDDPEMNLGQWKKYCENPES